MKVMLLHLSDIHFGGPVDAVSSRLEAMVRVVPSVDPTVEHYILVLTGDVAFSGMDKEYERALDFICQLQELLLNEANAKTVGVVMVPGNHDCDFRADNAARRALVESLNHGMQLDCIDESFIRTCCEVQDNFFKFRSLFDGPETGNRLCYLHRFAIGRFGISVRCINTAWLSTLDEQQGSLRFPTHLLEELDTHIQKDDLVISALHHTYAWLNATNGKALRQYLEESSDLILTGHEHVPDAYTVSRNGGASSNYVEGGVFQDHGDLNRCCFNIIIVDLEAKLQKAIQVSWKGDYFEPEQTDAAWQDLVRHRRSLRNRLRNNEDYLKELDDPGAPYKHPRKPELKLEDIYVYPCFKELGVGSKADSKTVSLGEILDHFSTPAYIAISGSEKSGKTALARVLYKRLWQSGIIAILISGDTFQAYDEDGVLRNVKKAFSRQYSESSYAVFAQLEPRQKAVIVDDYHAVRLNAKGMQKQLQVLRRLFGTIIILGHELMQIEDMISNGDRGGLLVSFRNLVIMPFGHYLRSELVEKWIRLGQEHEIDDVTLSARKRNVEAVLNGVLGRNLVPSYPIFLLTIIQAIETQFAVAPGEGSYGLLYQVLIAQALSTGLQRVGRDAKESFLSYLAFSMYERQQREIPEAEFRHLFSKYCEMFMAVSLESMVKDLLDSRLIYFNSAAGLYGFKYRYVYYYFTAKYISDNITDSEVRGTIKLIVRKLYVDENANIAAFLSYLSKDPVLLDEMLHTAREIYENESPCDLDKSVQFLDKLNATIPRLMLDDRDPDENRKDILKTTDQYEIASRDGEQEIADSSPEASDDEKFAQVLELNMAFRCIQVLGRLVRSFPGSVRKARKIAIVRECFALGMRAAGVVFRYLEADLDGLVEHITSEVLRDESEEAATRAQQFIYSLAVMFAFLIVKVISHSLGSPSLEDVYLEVMKQNPDLPFSLLHFEIKLEHFPSVPLHELEELLKIVRPDGFAHNLIRLLVFDYLYLNRVRVSIRDRLCHRVGISIRNLRGAELKAASNKALNA